MNVWWLKYVVMVVIVIVVTTIGIISIKFLGNDNPIEEATEAVIKEEIGINVDLSKKTPQTQAPTVVSPDTKTTPSDTTTTYTQLGTPPGGTPNP